MDGYRLPSMRGDRRYIRHRRFFRVCGGGVQPVSYLLHPITRSSFYAYIVEANYPAFDPNHCNATLCDDARHG